MIRPLILDLLPDTPGATITDVTYWGTGGAEWFTSATLSDDGEWSTPWRGGHRPMNPHYITEFTVHNSPDTTTYTEGADTNEWTATIRRKQP